MTSAEMEVIVSPLCLVCGQHLKLSDVSLGTPLRKKANKQINKYFGIALFPFSMSRPVYLVIEVSFTFSVLLS